MIDLILNPKMIHGFLWALAAATLALAAALWALEYRKRRGVRYPLRLLLLAGSGPLIAAMWVVYNRIENAFGLDSVLGLGVNLILFCSVGAGAATLLQVVGRRERVEEAPRTEGKPTGSTGAPTLDSTGKP